jgi:type 1 glutamine amidotransferase
MVAVGLFLPALSVGADPSTPRGKIRILLTYGGHGFEEKPFFAMFDALPKITYTRVQLPQSADLLKPGLEKEYDVIVMYDMVNTITPAQRKSFVALLDRGIGVVALHHNMGAHRDWNEYRHIIGGRFILKPTEIDGKKYGTSGWDHDQELRVTIADKEHPITRGLKDFTIHDEVYNKYYVAPDVKVLLTTDHPKNDPKIAWVKEYGKSRVFFLMLGHDSKAWKNPNYPEILSRGIRWAAGR